MLKEKQMAGKIKEGMQYLQTKIEGSCLRCSVLSLRSPCGGNTREAEIKEVEGIVHPVVVTLDWEVLCATVSFLQGQTLQSTFEVIAERRHCKGNEALLGWGEEGDSTTSMG